MNTIDGGECKQIGQYLLFSMSPNQQTITTHEARNSIGKSESCFLFDEIMLNLDGNARVYPTNLITNDNASIPLSSTPPPTSPTTGKTLVHLSSNISIDEQNFPRLPSPPQGVYD